MIFSIIALRVIKPNFKLTLFTKNSLINTHFQMIIHLKSKYSDPTIKLTILLSILTILLMFNGL